MSRGALFWITWWTVGLPMVLYLTIRDFVRWRRDMRRKEGLPPFVSPAAPVVVPTVPPRVCSCGEPITSWAHDDHPGFCSDNCAAMAPKAGGAIPPPRSSGLTTPAGFPARIRQDDDTGEE